MDLNYAPPLLSRILLAVSSLVLVGVVFMFVSRALEQPQSNDVTVQKRAQTFNSKADVSKNPVFPLLKTNDLQAVPDLPMGRDNPFMVAGSAPVATSSIMAPNKMLPGKVATSTTSI